MIEFFKQSAVVFDIFTANHEGRDGKIGQKCHRIAVVEGENRLQTLLQPSPMLSQRKRIAYASLQMQVVGRGSPAARAVVKNGQVGKFRRQLVNHRVVAVDSLRLVRRRRNGEVHRQNRERIDEQFELFAADGIFHQLGKLVRRTIRCTEETRPFFKAFRVDFRPCRDHPSGIPLHAQTVFHEGFRLHLRQIVVALPRLGPLRQLSVEKLVDFHLIGSFSAAPSVPSCAGGLCRGCSHSLFRLAGRHRCCPPNGGRDRVRRKCGRCATDG